MTARPTTEQLDWLAAHLNRRHNATVCEYGEACTDDACITGSLWFRDHGQGLIAMARESLELRPALEGLLPPPLPAPRSALEKIQQYESAAVVAARKALEPE